MRYLATVFAIGGMFAALSTSFAQKKFRIEKVTKEDLEMVRYDRDTSASAVILYNVGIFRAQDARFVQQMRVKILTKAGLEWGNWVFNSPSRGDFKVVVYNLVNGEVVTEKAGPANIFQEEVFKSYFTAKVFAPGVRAGSIIDITNSYDGMPFEWWFQERVPVVYSELILEPLRSVSFNTTQMGFEQVTTVSPIEWHASNMPAFQIEPYLNHYRNYITKFKIDLTSVGAGYSYFEISRSWSNVNRNLQDLQGFSDIIKGPLFLKDIVKEIKAKNLPVKERIEEAYRVVQANIKYNGVNRILAFGARANFATNHSGSVADVNLTLIGLLNDLDIKTYPVLLSTRDNGLLMEHAPSYYSLNYVVGYIRDGDVNMFVDATDEHLPPGMLPARCLNGRGLMIKKEGEEWIDLVSGQADFKRQFINISVGKDGMAKAVVSNDYGGYGYAGWVDESKKINYDAELAANQIHKANPDLRVVKYSVDRNDPSKASSKETLDLDLSERVIDAGDNILLTPLLLNELSDNPFKSETRKYPIDLSFGRDLGSTVVITLDGLEPVKLPPSERFTSVDGSATFTYVTGVRDNSVQIRAVLKITRTIYTESEYHDLRRFFSEVARKVSAPIEFRKL